MTSTALVMLVVSLVVAIGVTAGLILHRWKERRRRQMVAARYYSDLQLQRLTLTALAALLDETRRALLEHGRGKP